MEKAFDFLTVDFFKRAAVYPGSLGTFRYRFQPSGKMGEGTVQAWVYENISFELAKDVDEAAFPWTEEGVSALRDWLERKLEERGTEPYRIPYPPARTGEGE